MFTSISVENYRAFKQYQVNNLSRVNLLVGKNGSGKTSLLEAIHLLASGGSLEVFGKTAWRRGEVLLPDKPEEERPYGGSPVVVGIPSVVADVCHLFHGHEFGVGSQFRLRTDSRFGDMTVRVVEPSEGKESWSPFDEIFKRAPFRIAVRTMNPNVAGNEDMLFPVLENGAFPYMDYPSLRVPFRGRSNPSENVEFISSDSLTASPMSAMWNKVNLEGKEGEVIAAMRIIEPTLSNLFFLAGGNTPRAGGSAGIVVGLEGNRQRVPLGSFGEGMRRLLALSLSLVQTEGGILLVDEIDTGLHYSVMGDMWRLVIEAALRLNVHVFATTHSLDCVRGLAWLCENHPELAPHTSVQKIERRLEKSVALNANDIMTAVAQDIEVR